MRTLGHLPPFLGRIVEKDVKKLLELLGYSIIRENEIKPSIDKVIYFIGEPKPVTKFPCSLLEPKYSLGGYLAVSIKKGNFTERDVDDLLQDIEEAQNSDDDTLKKIENGLIVTNYLKSPSEIDDVEEKGVKCWDLSRLFLYSSKGRNANHLSRKGSVRECSIEVDYNITYLRQLDLETLKTEQEEKQQNAIPVSIIVYIDEHKNEFIFSPDHYEGIIDQIYENELKNINENYDVNLNVQVELHVLNLINHDLVRKKHAEYTRKFLPLTDRHIGTIFKADLPIFQYRISPWSILLE